MRKTIITLLVLSSFLSWSARADDVQVKEGAPDRYVVVKGDTLWGISGKFLNEPWRWPEIWQLNKEQIKNPHWIYPGDVVVLDNIGGKARLKLVKNERYAGQGLVVMKPAIRTEPYPASPAIPVISPADIGPFLSQPLVIEKDGLDSAPEIVASDNNHVIIGAGSRAYVAGLKAGDPRNWQVFRSGKPFIDPDTKETLGYEAIYLGEARVAAFGETSTIEIVKAVAEINRGDRLVRLNEAELANFVPHAPDKSIHGRILTVYAGVAEAGPKSIITINRGTKDGIEPGVVLAINRLGVEVPVTQPEAKADKPLRSMDQTECLKKDAKVSFNEFYDRSKAWGPCPKETPADKGYVKLPEERYGLLLVFRSFDRISYGLVMQASEAVHQGDVVVNP
jgi:hypothetical protein